MYKGNSITLVIPCKNEQDSLPLLLKKIPRIVDEVLVIDNNSSDHTMDVAKKLGAKVLIEKRKDAHGIGYGFAHQKGMKYTSSDIIVTMDGDGTYPLKEVRTLVKKLVDEQCDFVLGSRFPLQHAQAISSLRKLGVWILNTQVLLLYGYPMQDILSGMWAVRKNTVKKIRVKQGGWDLSPEIKLAALTHPTVKFAEVNIDHYHRDNGASKQKLWETGFNHLRYILKRKITIDNPISAWVKSPNVTVRLPSWSS